MIWRRRALMANLDWEPLCSGCTIPPARPVVAFGTGHGGYERHSFLLIGFQPDFGQVADEKRKVSMRIITSAGFGFALAVSAFAVASAPSSAIESPALISRAPNHFMKVDDRDRERCERVRRECRDRHHEREKEFRECVEREHCEP
jgi:hypothetical protein